MPGEMSRRLRSWVYALFTLAVAAEFLVEGVKKLLGSPNALEPFVEFGWPLWFATVTAVVEISSAVLLCIPRTRAIAAMCLAGVMLGAGFTNIANGHPDYVWLNVLLLVATVFIAWRSVIRPTPEQHDGSTPS